LKYSVGVKSDNKPVKGIDRLILPSRTRRDRVPSSPLKGGLLDRDRLSVPSTLKRPVSCVSPSVRHEMAGPASWSFAESAISMF